MNLVEQKIDSLREHLESAAFLVAQPAEHKAAHSEILKALMSLTELSLAYEQDSSIKSIGVSNAQEINKVKRRLKLWAKRSHQMNARILTAYLKLEKQGEHPITERALNEAIGSEPSFASNFLQMRISAEKNHGKVFELVGDKVQLWPPVVSAVRDYEKSVLATNENRRAVSKNRKGHGKLDNLKDGGANMNQERLVRKLNSVGKRVFVEEYGVFLGYASGQMSREMAINALVNSGVSNEAGAAIRVGNAKQIFDAREQKTALNIVCRSQQVPRKTRDRAASLLQSSK